MVIERSGPDIIHAARELISGETDIRQFYAFVWGEPLQNPIAAISNRLYEIKNRLMSDHKNHELRAERSLLRVVSWQVQLGSINEKLEKTRATRKKARLQREGTFLERKLRFEQKFE